VCERALVHVFHAVCCVLSQTYEYGMLRAQGMRQHVLSELLLIQVGEGVCLYETA
jgi:hypothetical protein